MAIPGGTATEPAATDAPAARREQNPAATCLTIIGATATGTATTNTSSAERHVNPADSCLTTSDTTRTTLTCVRSPGRVKLRPPPLDTHRLLVKLYELFAQQQCGEDIGLPCHVKRDRWNSTSTPPSSFWLTNAAASPSAANGGRGSTERDSPVLPKTPSSLCAEGMTTLKRKLEWNYDKYPFVDDAVESKTKRQKRWLDG